MFKVGDKVLWNKSVRHSIGTIISIDSIRNTQYAAQVIWSESGTAHWHDTMFLTIVEDPNDVLKSMLCLK